MKCYSCHQHGAKIFLPHLRINQTTTAWKICEINDTVLKLSPHCSLFIQEYICQHDFSIWQQECWYNSLE